LPASGFVLFDAASGKAVESASFAANHPTPMLESQVLKN
jgi:hypothetical protein